MMKLGAYFFLYLLFVFATMIFYSCNSSDIDLEGKYIAVKQSSLRTNKFFVSTKGAILEFDKGLISLHLPYADSVISRQFTVDKNTLYVSDNKIGTLNLLKNNRFELINELDSTKIEYVKVDSGMANLKTDLRETLGDNVFEFIVSGTKYIIYPRSKYNNKDIPVYLNNGLLITTRRGDNTNEDYSEIEYTIDYPELLDGTEVFTIGGSPMTDFNAVTINELRTDTIFVNIINSRQNSAVKNVELRKVNIKDNEMIDLQNKLVGSWRVQALVKNDTLRIREPHSSDLIQPLYYQDINNLNINVTNGKLVIGNTKTGKNIADYKFTLTKDGKFIEVSKDNYPRYLCEILNLGHDELTLKLDIPIILKENPSYVSWSKLKIRFSK